MLLRRLVTAGILTGQLSAQYSSKVRGDGPLVMLINLIWVTKWTFLIRKSLQRASRTFETNFHFRQ
jgi:hypothetical protein